MNIFRFCGIALLTVCMVTLLRQWKREGETMLKLAAVGVTLSAAAGAALPLFSELRELCESSLLSGAMGLLLRGVLIALAVKLTSDICREQGAASLASAIELLGRVEVLVLSLPLIREVTRTVGELMG